MKRISCAVMGVIAALVIAGCGANVEQAQKSSTASAVTVTNCNAPLTVMGVPTRVLSNDTGITEILFALGLDSRMVGYTTYAGKERDVASSPWRADFASVHNLGNAFTREVITSSNADFVFAGWNYGFKESTGVTPDWIRSIGATPYQLTEACRQPGTTQRGIMRPFDALYTDIDNLGAIFGVSNRANALVAGYRAQVAKAAAAAPPIGSRARVFLFDSADPAPFTSGHNAAPDQIITEAGGTNIFSDLNDSWTTTSWESASQRDPQAIVIVDYGDGPQNTVAAKIAQLRSNPLMAQTTAVRENNIIALPYAGLVEGPRNPQSVTTLAEFLRSKGY